MKDGIVAFSFGVPASIRANQQIARIAVNKAQQVGDSMGSGWVYTQADIQFEEGMNVVAFYTTEEGGPPPTLRIARGAVRWAVEQGFSCLWVAAAKPHLWRCLRDLEQAVREVGANIEVLACEEIEQYPEDSWFCPDSTQERVRSREAWDGREKVLKLMPFFLYKRVAS